MTNFRANRKFRPQAYKENDSLGKNTIIDYLKNNGHKIVDIRENYSFDIKSIKNGNIYYSEVEMKNQWKGDWNTNWKEIRIPYRKYRLINKYKKVEADNVISAETSAITRAVSKLNDESNGELGTATTLTQAKENTQGEKRLINELVELEKATLKMIDLIAKSPNTKSRETLLRVYVHIVNKLQSKDFGQYLKVHSKANVEFSPRVKGRPFDTSMGDFNKYLKQA